MFLCLSGLKENVWLSQWNLLVLSTDYLQSFWVDQLNVSKTVLDIHKQ